MGLLFWWMSGSFNSTRDRSPKRLTIRCSLLPARFLARGKTESRHDVRLPPSVDVRPHFTNPIGVSHLDLQVQQHLVYSGSHLGHLYTHRTDNSDPKVGTTFGRFATQALSCMELSSQRSRQDLCYDRQESTDRHCVYCNCRLPTCPRYSRDFSGSNTSRWALNSQRITRVPLQTHQSYRSGGHPLNFVW